MLVKRITECSKGNILQYTKLPFVIKIFVLSIFEWPFYTGFTVLVYWSFIQNMAESTVSNISLKDNEIAIKFNSSKCY